MAVDPICGMEVDERTALSVEHEGRTWYFCSRGCRDRFLAERSLVEPAAAETERGRPEAAAGPGLEKATLDIKGMHCASCAVAIEDSLNQVDGVSRASVNFATERAYVDYDPQKVSREALEGAVERAGYGVIEEETQALTLKVIGMDNAHCIGTVEAALNGVPGVI